MRHAHWTCFTLVVASLLWVGCARPRLPPPPPVQATPKPSRCHLCDAVAQAVRVQLQRGQQHHEAYALGEAQLCPGCKPRCAVHCAHADEARAVAACFAAQLDALGDGEALSRQVKQTLTALPLEARREAYDGEHPTAMNLAPPQFTNGPTLTNTTITKPELPWGTCQGGLGDWRYDVPVAGGSASADALVDTAFDIPPSALTTTWRYDHVPRFTLTDTVTAHAPAAAP